MPPTLEQKRALHAWNAVKKVLEFPNKKDQEEYQGEAKKLPSRIINAGLGQALAFIHAKRNKKKPLELLEEHISDWILIERKLLPHIPNNEKLKTLLVAIVESNSSEYLRRVTDETIAYMIWLNRFLEAQIESDNKEKNDGTTQANNSPS
jgi:CRISPR-associated protein Cmr5